MSTLRVGEIMRSFTKEDLESPVLVHRLRKYARETRALIGPVNPDVVNSALARIAHEADDRAQQIDQSLGGKTATEATPAQVAA